VKGFCTQLKLIAALFLFPLAPCMAQTAPQPSATTAAAPAAAKSGGVITGSVKSGNFLLPGVAISAANTLTGKKVFTSTSAEGTFSLNVTSKGRWVVRAELAAFAPMTKEVLFTAETLGTTQRADFEMILLSRQQKLQEQQQTQAAQQLIANAISGGRGFQSLSLNQSETGAASEGGASAGNGESLANSMPVAAMGGNAAADSVAVTGNMGRTENFGFDENELRARIEEAVRNRGGSLDSLGGGQIQISGGPGGLGGPGGPGGGPGGGGPGIMIMGGGGGGGRGFRGFDINKPHGQIFYNFSNSALDARPYSLTGISAQKPSYSQSRYGFFIGGPLNIPHVYEGGTKTMYFLNYFGLTSSNPFDVFATVPTAAERIGDFSQTRIRGNGPNAGNIVSIFDPAALTGAAVCAPIVGNVVPACRISAAAKGLLSFFPAPNQPGDTQNYHAIGSSDNNSHNVNFRLNHNFGETAPRTQGAARGGGGRGNPFGSRHSLQVGFNYRTANSTIQNYSPFLGGTGGSNGYNVNVNYTQAFHGLVTRSGFVVNKNHLESNGQYANVTDVESGLGIQGVSTNPFDFGVPTISLTNYSGLRDVTPQLRDDTMFQLSESISWNHKKHNVRFGGDFRRTYSDVRSNSNPRGSFTFTGFSTAKYTVDPVTNKLVATPGTGYDFADFLLGLPQQNAAQFSQKSYNFNGNGYNLFIQDDWRVRGKLTINFGLRYEYISPLSEASGQLVNLDAAPGFTAVAPVQPNQIGPFTGVFPGTLVNPDRNNFAPRIGIAWSPLKKTVLRGGYGVNYNLGQYNSIVQQLALQPPFAVTETNTASIANLNFLSLQNIVAPAVVTNNFGVDRNYRLGYTQTWNTNVQQELPKGLMLNVDYTGTKGTRLDMQRAPNRTATGLLINGAQPFIWESSDADSILHSGSVRIRKRLQHGISFGGSYVYSKSIDNASSIGGGAIVVAQNDKDLIAERGLSSFDQRHRFTADYVYELPWGTNKHWLNTQNWASRTFGDWSFSGNVTVAGGTPFTARVIGSLSDINSGTNGTLRANYNGQPINISNPTISQWFNTAAFTVPIAGTFGDSGRNMIIGPGTFNVNTSLSKSIPIKDNRSFEFRATATNLFNHVNYSVIDTVVNSPTFGQVTSVGSMRKMQIQTQFRF
jgi:hypothetical protein